MGATYRVHPSSRAASDCPSQLLTAWRSKSNPQPHYHKVFQKNFKENKFWDLILCSPV